MSIGLAVFTVALAQAVSLLESTPGPTETPALAEPGAETTAQAQGDPHAPADPASLDEDTDTLFIDDSSLTTLAAGNIDEARPVLRRSARSAPSAVSRALALRLLAQHDGSAATVRICMRALRIDDSPLVRRAGAECLGWLGPPMSAFATPALVAALDDSDIDVVTMAGWALAVAGDSSCISAVAARTTHPDGRVALLFSTYTRRLLVRLELVPLEPMGRARDAAGRELVPPGATLNEARRDLEQAISVGWLGLYGASVGFLHGASLMTAHGGSGGTNAAGLAGLAGAALAAAAASGHALATAERLVQAHTIVHFGVAGTLAGWGAGILSGFPPSSAVSAANLSFVGTLAGTAAGYAMATAQTPSPGALGAGLATGLAGGVALGALWRGYGLASNFTMGVSLLGGSTAAMLGTLAFADTEVGLFPVAGALAGTLIGSGAGAMASIGPSASVLGNEAAGWTVAGATVAGAAAGVIVGLALPRRLDPLIGARLPPASARLTAVEGHRGTPVPVLAFAASLP